MATEVRGKSGEGGEEEACMRANDLGERGVCGGSAVVMVTKDN